MSELLNVRCKQGRLIITDQQIRVELGQLSQKAMNRSALTSMESDMVAPSVFGMGGGSNLIFHGQGSERLHADMVGAKDVKKVKKLLGY